MSDQNHLHERRLTPAAAATLEEYLDLERVRILAEATKLSTSLTLRSADIVNGYESIQSRRGPTRASAEVAIQRDTSLRRRLLVAASSLPIMVGGISVLYAVGLPNSSAPDTLAWLFALLGLGAAIAATFASYLFVVQGRRAARFQADLVSNLELSSTDSPKEYERLEADAPTLGQFMLQWRRVEVRLRKLAELVLDMPADVSKDFPIGPMIDRMLKGRSISPGLAGRIRAWLAVRNSIVHASDGSVDVPALSAEMGRVQDLAAELEELIEQHESRMRQGRNQIR